MQQMEKSRSNGMRKLGAFLFFVCLSYTSWYLFSLFVFRLVLPEDVMTSLDIVAFGFSPVIALVVTIGSLRLIERRMKPKFIPLLFIGYMLSTSVLIYYSVAYALLPRL
ncbi:hypothetical protein Q9R23_08365 [Exiguobacterium sp. BRG2]|uniref:hypothetical protein n=1 Tax=Exiguobacterium sp. BRG2 TaxID=2962584 RepID=UPI0028819A80|nr:hypothetical protein [Exiguobacterium sp. BRG2]MDT0172984.1 hypothetical protein [Exiguobacterium sp. BRG2]